MWSVVEVRKVRSDTRLMLCEIAGMKNFDIRKDMDKVPVLKSIAEMEPDRLRLSALTHSSPVTPGLGTTSPRRFTTTSIKDILTLETISSSMLMI